MKSDVSLHRYGNRELSDRECQIIALVAKGLKNRDIGKSLGITEAVIKNYLRRIYDKVGVWNRVELALWYEARQHPNPKPHKPEKIASPENERTHIAGRRSHSVPASRTTTQKPPLPEEDDVGADDKSA